MICSHRQRLVTGLRLLPLLALSIGCGPGDAYTGPYGQVSGTVTLDGNAPSTTLTVSFANLEKGFTAAAKTDGSGKYSLMTNGSPDIPVGSYKVTVVAPAASEEVSPEAAMEATMNNQGQETPAATAIPAKYAAPGTSGLSFEIKEGPNSYDIPLTSK